MKLSQLHEHQDGSQFYESMLIITLLNIHSLHILEKKYVP